MIEDFTEREAAGLCPGAQAALLDISLDAICVQSLAGRIEFWNPAAEKLYGWTRAEAVGAAGDDLLFGLVSGELLQARTDVLTLGCWSGELQLAARGGRILHVHSRFRLVRDAQGQPQSILIGSTDRTEKKQLEQQLLRAQRMACIGTLASGVGHDLNNVFAPILMVAELLASRSVDPAEQELLALLRDAADRGAGIVRQLLVFSRGQASERVELHVEHLLKDLRRLAQETFPKNIHLAVQLPPGLWPVMGDVTQIHQVLLNLCVNARDAMPDGGTLSLAAQNFQADVGFCQSNPAARPGPFVLLEVADTGSGIPAAIRDQIFDPGFTTKPPGVGTGLGLATVLGIVKAHHGFLDLSSQVGEGTRLRVFLPAVPPGAAPPVSAPAAAVGHGEHVLVVDDEEAILLVIKQVLLTHGYVPLVAQNGEEALALFNRHQADIRFVLTDMMMPGMDGAAIIQAIRQRNPEVPIVIMTGLLAGHLDANLAGQKHISCLKKPFTGEALLHALQAFSPGPPPPPSP